jgi:hypothetical protein
MDRVIFKHHHVVERRTPSVDSKQQEQNAASVRLVREGAHVRALDVLCACGERITVELAYEMDGRPAAPNQKP